MLKPKQVLAAVESTVRHPISSLTRHPVKTAAVVLGGFLLVDYLVAPHGGSVVAKTLNKVLPKHVTTGLFGPGWRRGNMPLMYGGHFPQVPADVSAAHNSWAAAAGQPQQYYSQSAYPWA
jgi:hypothetical protein